MGFFVRYDPEGSNDEADVGLETIRSASLAVVGEARAAGNSTYTQQHNTMTGNLGCMLWSSPLLFGMAPQIANA